MSSMEFDVLLAGAEFGGDLFVQLTLDDQVQDLALTPGKGRQAAEPERRIGLRLAPCC